MTHLNNLTLVIEQYVFLGLVYVLVFGIGVALYYAVWLKSIEDVEERLMIQQMVLERQWKKDIEEETKKLRILRHDMNNHIAVLKLLCDSGQEDELKEYIEEMFDFNEYVDGFALERIKYGNSIGLFNDFLWLCG